MGFATVTVGTASTLIVGVNPERISLAITNNGAGTVFLAPSSSVTTSGVLQGIKLVSGGTLTEDAGNKGLYCGDYYGISSDGTNAIAYWERTR